MRENRWRAVFKPAVFNINLGKGFYGQFIVMDISSNNLYYFIT